MESENEAGLLHGLPTETQKPFDNSLKRITRPCSVSRTVLPALWIFPKMLRTNVFFG